MQRLGRLAARFVAEPRAPTQDVSCGGGTTGGDTTGGDTTGGDTTGGDTTGGDTTGR